MARTPRTNPNKAMADALMDGQLETQLRRYRELQLSWPAISRILRDEYRVYASAETLQSWGKTFGLSDTGSNGDAA